MAEEMHAQTNESRQVVLRLIQDGLNGHSRAVMDALTSDDRVMHEPGGQTRIGPYPLGTSAAERSWALFPDWRYEIEAILAEGEMVAVRVRASGTHASGATVTTTWSEIFRVRGGKIVEAWLDTDIHGFNRQLRALGDAVDVE